MLAGGSLLSLTRDMLRHRHAEWDGRLQASIRAVGETGRPMSLVLPDGWGKSCRLSIKRMDSAALNMGLRQAVGVHIERHDVFNVPSAEMLRELFGLSFAEAALCHYLVAGPSVKECAVLLGITESTARKQLASIFRKTGCNRQTELIRLASGL
jgi:DNA-binding CsgD family transcriptional regulator